MHKRLCGWLPGASNRHQKASPGCSEKDRRRKDRRRKMTIRINFTRYFIAFLTTLTATAAVAASGSGYKVLDTYKIAGEGSWDYLTADAATRRLYITRATHVIVFDMDSGKIVGDIADTPGVHGVALAPELGRGFTTNGRESTASIFD